MRILYVDIDTLRPDHMGCYGYARDTTPNIDSVARDGVRFDRCYCSDAPCLPSRAALISGQFGIRNGAVGHGGTAADRRLSGRARDFSDYQDDGNFNQIFRKAGLHTASISTFAERHSSFWYQAGFNETYNVGGRGGESGEKVLPVALDWLARNREREDWFLHLHLWDPHTPYRAPESFGDPFADAPLPQWLTEEIFSEHQRLSAPHGCNEIGMYSDAENPAFPRHPGAIREYAELRRMFDGYDTGVRYADFLLGEVFALLRAQGVYEDMAVIISSDHGENLGELGIYAEHGTADDITCHIPLIIKWPGGARGACEGGFHYLLDLCPTMAELLSVKKSAHWDGESFASAVQTGAECGRESLVLSQMAHVCQRAARFEDYVYIRSVHDGFRLFDDEMLFDVRADAHETRDIKAERPDLCARGAKIILDWQEAQMKKSASDADPMWTVMREGGPHHTLGCLNSYAERLEKTGRADKAALLRKKFKA